MVLPVYGGVKVVGVGAIFLATTVVIGIVLSAATLWRRKKWNSRAAVGLQRGKIAKIMIYPIKSCHGISVQSAKCTPTGLENGILRDRSFMIVDNEKNKFISPVENPSSVLIKPSLLEDGKTMCINAPDMEPLRLDVEHLDRNKGNRVTIKYHCMTMIGYDCGDQPAEWFQTFLKRPNLRLVYLGLDLPPAKVNRHKEFGKIMKKTDMVTYSLTAYSVYSESSHEDLIKRLQTSVPITNFRPNVIVNGTDPYDEDNWDVLRFGEEAVLQVRKLGQRCAQVTVNAEDGTKNNSITTTLFKYRKCWDENLNKMMGSVTPIMGLNVGFERAGSIRVGDPVYVTYK